MSTLSDQIPDTHASWTEEEIELALSQMKHTTPGPNGTTSDALKNSIRNKHPRPPTSNSNLLTRKERAQSPGTSPGARRSQEEQ